MSLKSFADIFLFPFQKRTVVPTVSVAVMAIGLMVMVGWKIENSFWIRVLPDFPAMVFNTALGFFLCAVALFFHHIRKTVISISLGAVGGVIGALSLSQYFFNIHLGIDELFMEDFIQSNADYPGRMSLVTALCFVLTGISLAFLPVAKRFFVLPVIIEALCVFNILLSLVALIDHVGLIDVMYSWFLWESMAIHTSLSFMILNSAVLLIIWTERDRKVSPFYVTMPSFFLISAIIFDSYTPLGVAAGFLYMPFVLCAFWRRSFKAHFIFAFVATVLIVLGFYASVSADVPITNVLINRSGAIVGIWIIAGLIYILKLRESTLQDNAERLDAIVSNTVDGMITIDEYGSIETFNKACEGIFGYEAEDVIGLNVKVLMPEPYHSEHDGYLQNYHDTGDKKIIGIGREVEGQRQDGSVFPLDLSVSEVNVQGRKIYSGIVRDVTERKEAEESIKQVNSELEEFSYRTSHDLRSPLVSSISLLSIAEEAIRSDDHDKALESLRHVQTSLTKLESLVTDILLLTRVKNEEEEESVIDLKVIIEEALNKFKHMENFERLQIEQDLRFLDSLCIKKNRLMLIVENLISNAVKYQDLKKSVSFLKISTSLENNIFVLEVRDNGLGVPESLRESLFKMFKRFHPRVSFGSGLGLYMMKKSAEILGGGICFEDPGEGAIFRLEIPLTESMKAGDLNR